MYAQPSRFDRELKSCLRVLQTLGQSQLSITCPVEKRTFVIRAPLSELTIWQAAIVAITSDSTAVSQTGTPK